jgi:hypothetical protein
MTLALAKCSDVIRVPLTTDRLWRKAVVDLLTGISPPHEAKISIKTLRASGARGWEMFSKPPIYA